MIGIPYQIILGSKSTIDKYEFKEVDARPAHLIGGAEKSMEIDAKRAIKQGVDLANRI